jgi:hypothetical protein
MLVYCVDGPKKGEFIDTDAKVFRIPVINFVSYADTYPPDVPPDYEIYDYTVQKLGYALSWYGGVWKAQAFVASVRDLEYVPGNELNWEYREIRPDFEYDFEGWFANQLGQHAPWTMEYELRQSTLDYLRVLTTEKKLKIQ